MKISINSVIFLLIEAMDSKWNFKYYRAVNRDDKSKDTSPLSLKLKTITGFYANDYIKPVISENGKIVSVIADESEFKNHFGSSLIILLKNDLLKKIEIELEDLINEYGINNIHFKDFFGRKKILNNRRDNFLEEYSNIVSKIPMSCLSISKTKDNLLEEMQSEEATNEEIFFSLFWNNFERIISAFPNHSIFHIYIEQEYSITPRTTKKVVPKLFEKLYSALDQLYLNFPDKYISVCKHPQFFTKKALLYSSLADFVAFGSNKIQNKIDSNVPDEKIIKEYKILLKMFKSIFNNYSGLSSNKLIELIDKAQ